MAGRVRGRVGAAVACAVAVLGAGAAARAGGAALPVPLAAGVEQAVVAAVYDGDTLTLRDGRKVRLLQVDTPELASGECYGRAAATMLKRLLPAGSPVLLEPDTALDATDRYGRLLRVVRKPRGSSLNLDQSLNVNLELVRLGAAAPYFYRGERGRYATQILAAGQAARAAKRGLWGACPGTALSPTRAVDTGTSGAAPARVATPATATSAARSSSRCDPAYPGVCIPPGPPDLDCADIPDRRFKVLSPDPHNFDGRDHDGLGCESG